MAVELTQVTLVTRRVIVCRSTGEHSLGETLILTVALVGDGHFFCIRVYHAEGRYAFKDIRSVGTDTVDALGYSK